MAGQPIKHKALINVDLGEAVCDELLPKETLTELHSVWQLLMWS